MRRWTSMLVAAALVAGAFAVGLAADDEPQEVTVAHILIGFKRSVPGQEIDRSKRDARALAEGLLEQARAGEDFDALMEAHTDDRGAGVYTLTNHDAPIRADATQRSDMVPGFGDAAFSLEPGEVALVTYHAARSPYGFHVIKRLE